MERTGRLYGCPVELTLDLLGGKWKTVILARLKQAPLRYGELRRAVPGLSDKVLTQRLRDLEAAGLIERSKPARGQVCYRLTPTGRSLSPALEAMYEWGMGAAPRLGARFRATRSSTPRSSR